MCIRDSAESESGWRRLVEDEGVLDTAGGWIVYRTGRAIRLMDAVTGAKQLLVTARATPLGLSIESRRVAWAENRLGHGRVRGVLAPFHP